MKTLKGAKHTNLANFRDEAGVWRIWGEKLFCSNPTADLVLILARPEGAGAGTRGLVWLHEEPFPGDEFPV